MGAKVKLADLHPQFVDSGGPGITNSKTGEPVPLRKGTHIMFDCPCGCDRECLIPLDPPMDGGPPVRCGGSDANPKFGWKRTGETFETLTLRPSILRLDGCRWHGFITNGMAETC